MEHHSINKKALLVASVGLLAVFAFTVLLLIDASKIKRKETVFEKIEYNGHSFLFMHLKRHTYEMNGVVHDPDCSKCLTIQNVEKKADTPSAKSKNSNSNRFYIMPAAVEPSSRSK